MVSDSFLLIPKTKLNREDFTDLIEEIENMYRIQKDNIFFIYMNISKYSIKEISFFKKVIVYDLILNPKEACIYKTNFYFISIMKKFSEYENTNFDFGERNILCNPNSRIFYLYNDSELKKLEADFLDWTQIKNEILKEKQKVKKLKAFFFGDSLSISFTWVFKEKFQDNYSIEIENYGKVSSGLVIKKFFDWENKLESLIENKNFNLAYLMIGANDTQSISHGNQIFQFGSEDWSFEYQYRVLKIMNILESKKIIPHIILLPTVKSNFMNIKYSKINQVFLEVCKIKNILCINIDEEIGNQNGIFSTLSNFRNKKVLMRQEDGIHFSVAGTEKMKDKILKQIFGQYEFINVPSSK